MDKIKSISRIFKSDVSQKAKQANVSSKKHTKKAPKKPQKNINETSSERLKATVAEKISKLDKNRKDYELQSKKIFLESVFASEFGEEFINDPEFHHIVEKVHSMMENNEKTNTQLKLILESLS